MDISWERFPKIFETAEIPKMRTFQRKILKLRDRNRIIVSAEFFGTNFLNLCIPREDILFLRNLGGKKNRKMAYHSPLEIYRN